MKMEKNSGNPFDEQAALNPFFSEIEGNSSSCGSKKASSSWDSIASKLLGEKFLLTALELHNELLDAGIEVPKLANFFSNPANFDLTASSVVVPSLANICKFTSYICKIKFTYIYIHMYTYSYRL